MNKDGVLVRRVPPPPSSRPYGPCFRRKHGRLMLMMPAPGGGFQEELKASTAFISLGLAAKVQSVHAFSHMSTLLSHGRVETFAQQAR